MKERRGEASGEGIRGHIFQASAVLVGLCLSLIGIFGAVKELRGVATLGDELLAVAAICFLLSCVLSYVALRAQVGKRRDTAERSADAVFLAALCLLVLIGGLIAFEIV